MQLALASWHEEASPSPSPKRYPDSEHDSTIGGSFVNDNFVLRILQDDDRKFFPVLGYCCSRFSGSACGNHDLVSTDILLAPKKHNTFERSIARLWPLLAQ